MIRYLLPGMNPVPLPISKPKSVNTPQKVVAEDEVFIVHEDIETKKQVKSFNYLKQGIELGYTTKNSLFKTVLVIGDSRIGKSQFIKNIVNPGSVEQLEAYAVTAAPIDHNLSVIYGDVNMNIDFIDSPGFNEKTQTAPRTNEKIEKIISDKLKQMTTKIDVIFIVVQKVTEESVKAIKLCVNMFGTTCTNNMHILFTHFEGLGKEVENDYVNMFNTDRNLRTIAPYFKDRILFTGCISANMMTHPSQMKEVVLQQIERNKKILDVIRDSVPFQLSDSVSSLVSTEQNPRLILDQVVEKYEAFKLLKTKLQLKAGEIMMNVGKFCKVENKKLVLGEVKDFLTDDEINRMVKIYNTAQASSELKTEEIKTEELVLKSTEIENLQKQSQNMLKSIISDIQTVEDKFKQLADVEIVIQSYHDKYRAKGKLKDNEDSGFRKDTVEDL